MNTKHQNTLYLVLGVNFWSKIAMQYLLWGVLILFGATLIYYIVFFSLIYYWHLKRITYVIVPLIFTFEFFLLAFLVVGLGLIVANYFPVVWEAIKEIRFGVPHFR